MKCQYTQEVKRLGEARLEALRGQATCGQQVTVDPQVMLELIEGYEGKLFKQGCECEARPGSAFCEEHHQVVLHQRMTEMQNQLAAQRERDIYQFGRMGGEGK